MNACFTDLVNRECDKLERGEPFYIGEGNPDSNILIIGNECAIGDDDYRLENDVEFQSLTDPVAKMLRKEKVIAEHNVRKWKYITERNDVVENLHSDLYRWHYGTDSEVSELLQKDRHRFYPLFPEFGQKCTTGKGGTARTWVRYQQLINGAVDNHAGEVRNLIDFHHFCFHTELSQIPLKSSKMADTALTRRSVQLRMEQLFTHPFFRKFPVIIIAAGHYVDKYVFKNNDGQYDDKRIIKTFNVAYDRSCGRKGAWIQLHHGGNDCNSPHLLLHTCHLCCRAGYDYIEDILELIYDVIGVKVYLNDSHRNKFIPDFPIFGKKFEISSPYDLGKTIFTFATEGEDALLCEHGHRSDTASMYDLLPGNTYAIIKNGIIKYNADSAEITRFYPQKDGNEYKDITAYDVKEYACRDGKIAECLREIERGEVDTLTGEVRLRHSPKFTLDNLSVFTLLRDYSKLTKINVAGDDFDSVIEMLRRKISDIGLFSAYILSIKVRDVKILYVRYIEELHTTISNNRGDIEGMWSVAEKPIANINFNITVYLLILRNNV